MKPISHVVYRVDHEYQAPRYSKLKNSCGGTRHNGKILLGQEGFGAYGNRKLEPLLFGQAFRFANHIK